MQLEQKEKPFHVHVAEAIVEARTFDVTVDNNGYPSLHWLISEYMLHDLPEHYRYSLMYSNKHAYRVAENLHDALIYIRDVNEMPVCAIRPKHEKAIVCVTLDPNYKRAEDAKYERLAYPHSTLKER